MLAEEGQDRCSSTLWWVAVGGGIRWRSWIASDIGGGDEGESLPVFEISGFAIFVRVGTAGGEVGGVGSLSRCFCRGRGFGFGKDGLPEKSIDQQLSTMALRKSPSPTLILFSLSPRSSSFSSPNYLPSSQKLTFFWSWKPVGNISWLFKTFLTLVS